MILNKLRPINLSDFHGKQNIANNLKIYIESAKARKTSLDHCLLYGLPGTGKTSLAIIIANEMKSNIKIVQGPSIEKPINIINLLLSLNENDILFIDEIHGVNQQCLELLYSAMEDFAIDISIGKDFNAKTTRIKIPNFTLIGSTTMLYKIPLPLEERFGIVFCLDEYLIDELCLICKRSAKILNLKLSNDEILLIAKNSKGIPRNLNKILKRILDYKTITKNVEISKILNEIGIVINGLNNDDINYLRKISSFNKPVGIKTICQYLSIDEETVEIKIEPYLLKNNYIQKTSSGRLITKEGKNILSFI